MKGPSLPRKRFSILPGLFSALSVLATTALALFGFARSAHADINTINQQVWQLKFGVTKAQLYLNGDPAQGLNTTWLNADDDGDGVKNKDELAAGTNPFSNTNTIKISSISSSAGNVTIQFPTENGKRYRVQSTTTLSNPASWVVPTQTPSEVVGDGNTQSIVLTYTPNTFFRIIVDDKDTSGGGVSDWAKKILGYNVNTTKTDGVNLDSAAIPGAMASLNQVTVTVNKPNATQPADAVTAPVDVGSITVSRGITKLGALTAVTPITVPLQKTGTATEGTDYDSLPSSVTFDRAGATQQVFTINPRYNANRRTNATAIVKALAGTGYTLGAAGSASVVINPAGIANGSGLSAAYYQGSSTTYTNLSNFGGGTVAYSYSSTTGLATISATGFTASNQVKLQFTSGSLAGGAYDAVYTISTIVGNTFTVPIAGAVTGSGNCILNPPALTRVDPVVDFSAYNASTNPTGWGAGSNGTSGTAYPITTANTSSAGAKYCVRWTGQVLPQYSETYTFDFRSDDGAKVWVNGVLLVDKWVSQGVTDWVNTINLQANVLYDIQIDHLNNGGGGEAHLYWWSPSQSKQIIPTSRLFPAPTLDQKWTALTNSLTAVGYVGTPFNFSVVTPNISGTVTYALDSNSAALPPGLSLNASTGAITGTPTLAGTYNVAVNATNAAANGGAGAVTGSSVVTITIYPVGSVTREILAANGTITADGTIPTLDDDQNYAAATTRRLRGYIIPPKTGNYYFWLAANNSAELWISNDSQYVNRVRRAIVTANTGKKTWNVSSTQQTPWLYLVAGQKYYFDVMHYTPGGGVDDYVAMGWCQDDIGTVPSTSTTPNSTGALTLIPNGGGALQGYPLSGTVPGYIFQPYDYPSVGASGGTLYAGSLGPQGSSSSKASGSVNLRVDPSNTFATLHFNYGNLTSPRTAYHLHTDAFDNHPDGEIIFDIDAEDAQHPEDKTTDGGYIWHLAPVGSFTSSSQLLNAIHLGHVYLNVHTVNYPAGEIRGNVVLVSGSQIPPDPTAFPEPTATDVVSNDAHVSRFLNQATFGASPADIAFVKANGFAAWIDNQLAQPASHSSGDVVANVTADINTPYPSSLFTDAWWKYSVTGPDQLRQRLAFALSEIMVVSWNNNTGPLQNNGRILADYYDQLVDYCLPTSGLQDSGSFRGILKAVTLTPAMGLYLDMRANAKGNDSTGLHPNENYAREIMQLFSVGLNRMWDDGNFVLDSSANLVPTYSQPTVSGMAALLTGWNYAQPNQANGRAPTNFGPAADYLNPMVLVPSQHDLNGKLLLNNVVTPAATGRTPRVSISSVATGTPACTVTTATVHGLTTGDTVTIAGVSGGFFSGSGINAAFQVTVTGATNFTVPISCTTPPSNNTGTVTGATVTAATFGTSGITAVTGSQSDSTGTTLPHPYDQYGLKELDAAMDNIVNNDNVPPYICRQLIQRFVTSNPSPGYLYRVVQKFKNNGSGVRGDMTAVIKQILLDGEARSYTAAAANPAFGKQREPMLRLTGAARAFPAASYTGTYTQLTGVDSNKLRIVTSTPNDFSSAFTLGLNFRGNYNPATGQTLTPGNVPTSTTYSVSSTTPIASTYLDISGISTGASPTTITCPQPHGMTGSGQVWFFGLSGKFSDTSINSGAKAATVVDANTFTVPITTTAVFQIASVATGSPCTVTTVAPHGLAAGATTGVQLNGVIGGTFSGGATSLNGTNFTVTNTGTNTFTVASSTGTAVNCTVAPTGFTTWRQCSNPCRVTTTTPHGLNNGDTVTIINVSGGSFTPTINGTYAVSSVTASAFTLAAVSCISYSTVNTGNIVGAYTLDVPATGMSNVAYSQPLNSNVLTVSTSGPQTNVTVPGTTVNISSIAVGSPCTVTTSGSHNLVSGGVVTIAGVTDGVFGTAINGTFVPTVTGTNTFTVPVSCTTAAATGNTTANLRSRVYLKFLTQTSAGGSAIPADGVYDVQTVNGTTNFTVNTADTPATARGGNVIVPKIATSYTPLSSNTIVQYNTNVNHNLSVGDHIWVDVPVVGSPVTDAEYAVATLVDEDHLTTSYLPPATNGGTYPKPSGSQNGIVIYPLVPPPMGRSGVVSINQSTFVIGATDTLLAQSPLNSPTVFNFYFPNYRFPGALTTSNLDSPEFQLSTDTNLSNISNSLTNMLIGTGGGNGNLNGLCSFNNGGGSIVMDLGAYMTPAQTVDSAIPALVDTLANLLVGAPLAPHVDPLTTDTRTLIINFVANTTNFPMTTPTPTNQQMRDRVRAIIHLIITSAEYAVQK